MSGYVHGDLLTSKARGWGQAKEEIVPFFFSHTLRSFSHSMLAHCRMVEKNKKTKRKKQRQKRKE